MLMRDFVLLLREKTNLSPDILNRLFLLCVRPDDTIDDEIFNKITFMLENKIPEEKIFVIITNSLDIRRNLDVKKFYDELGVYKNKLDPEFINQDIAKYESKLKQLGFETMPLVKAFQILTKAGLAQDFIFDEIFKYIKDSKTANNYVKDVKVNSAAVDAIVWMHSNGWSQHDIIEALKKQINGTPDFDLKKFLENIPKRLKVNQKKISKHDGSIKHVANMRFLKYINPVFKFFTTHSKEIVDLAQKYQKDNSQFAKEFYKMYTKYRGWDKYGPRLLIQKEDSAVSGGFSVEGMIILKNFNNQETIVNTIIHELTHFEQYLMLINTPSIGLKPYAKEYTLQNIAIISNAYSNDSEYRMVFDEQDYDTFEKKHGEKALTTALSRFKNDFYDNALKIPYKIITKDMPEYDTVKKLSYAIATAYNHANRGNKTFVYPTLFSEQMAFSVGNAGAGMFRNVIRNQSTNYLQNMNGILDLTTKTI